MAFGLGPWGGVGGGGGGGDSAAPGIVYDPASGAEIADSDPIVVRVTDAGGFGSIFILVKLPAIGWWEVVFDGTDFSPFYAESTIVSIANGFEFTVERGQWVSSPHFLTMATDAAGNFAQASAAYTLESAPVDPPVDPILFGSVDPVADTDGLRLAVLISLFSDKRSPTDAPIPAGDGDRRGWWADQFAAIQGDKIGSHLWLLDRATSGDNVVQRAEAAARDALAWLIEDRVASKVNVSATVENKVIWLDIEIHRPVGDPVSFRFAHHWDAEAAAPSLPPIIM